MIPTKIWLWCSNSNYWTQSSLLLSLQGWYRKDEVYISLVSRIISSRPKVVTTLLKWWTRTRRQDPYWLIVLNFVVYLVRAGNSFISGLLTIPILIELISFIIGFNGLQQWQLLQLTVNWICYIAFNPQGNWSPLPKLNLDLETDSANCVVCTKNLGSLIIEILVYIKSRPNVYLMR